MLNNNFNRAFFFLFILSQVGLCTHSINKYSSLVISKKIRHKSLNKFDKELNRGDGEKLKNKLYNLSDKRYLGILFPDGFDFINIIYDVEMIKKSGGEISNEIIKPLDIFLKSSSEFKLKLLEKEKIKIGDKTFMIQFKHPEIKVILRISLYEYYQTGKIANFLYLSHLLYPKRSLDFDHIFSPRDLLLYLMKTVEISSVNYKQKMIKGYIEHNEVDLRLNMLLKYYNKHHAEMDRSLSNVVKGTLISLIVQNYIQHCDKKGFIEEIINNNSNNSLTETFRKAINLIEPI